MADADPKTIQRWYSVMLERTVHELRGTPCFGPEDTPKPKQQIICSRSFGRRITDFAETRQAVSD